MRYQLNRKKKCKAVSYQLEIKKEYPLSSSRHHFVIEENKIKNIMVMNQKMIERLVSKKVKTKYDKLIKLLTNLLISEDDTGTCSREALNLIEKFRLEIKNKYRHYLKEKELKEMANQLKVMQKVALEKEAEIKSFLAEEYIGRSR